jgi:hypothetical protein
MAALVVTMAATVMDLIDGTVLQVALPELRRAGLLRSPRGGHAGRATVHRARVTFTAGRRLSSS